MGFYPVCTESLSLQWGVKIVAYLQILTGFVLVTNGTVDLIQKSYCFFNSEGLVYYLEEVHNATIEANGEVFQRLTKLGKKLLQPLITIDLLWLAFYSFALAMAVELLKGAEKRNLWRCNAWMRTQIAAVAVLIISILISFPVSCHQCDLNDFYGDVYNLHVLFMLSILIVSLYSMWVVHEFIKELRGDITRSVQESRGQRLKLKMGKIINDV